MTERCESCEHDKSYHPESGPCWFAVVVARPGLVNCACARWIAPVPNDAVEAAS